MKKTLIPSSLILLAALDLLDKWTKADADRAKQHGNPPAPPKNPPLRHRTVAIRDLDKDFRL